MIKIRRQLKNASLIFLSVSLLLSCSGGTSVSGGDSFPSVLPEDPTAGFDTDNFFIAVRNINDVTTHFRTSTSFSSRCEIAEGSTNQDLVCILDIPEGDLFYQGIELTYNVPPNMCRYLERRPYWYYNNEVGYGPRNVNITVNLDAAGVRIGSTCNIDGVISSPCNPNSYPDLLLEIEPSDITAKCVYDRSNIEEPNCCFGDYSLTKTFVRPSGTSTDTTDQTWGDPEEGMKLCLGGTGRTNWEDYNRLGFPAPLVTPAEEGLTENYNLPAPINTPNTARTFPVANYYSSPAVHTHTSFGSVLTSEKPYFVEPISDRSGSNIPSGNDSYEFRCLDEASEVRHRIRVYVREWDAYSDYLTYIATSGATEVPDRPADTDAACGGLVDDCNDFHDLDNYPTFLQDLAAELVIPAPTNEYYDQAGEVTRRIYNFPADEYE